VSRWLTPHSLIFANYESIMGQFNTNGETPSDSLARNSLSSDKTLLDVLN
jgi:hypothetical protein